jgi:RNA polymerase sigma factor (sigma-70 family)
MGEMGDDRDQEQWLVERFEEFRPHLRSVAYRMLGSLTEADDAVQDAWVRLSRAGVEGVDNLGGWLTTIVARISLNMLRSRTTRKEDPLSFHVPDPVVTMQHHEPEDQALLADSVGLAMLVVLDTLSPAERLAFVLHDMFGLPFDEIAAMVDRSPEAARQLASRARRRVRGAEPPLVGVDRARQRQIVDAFLSASRGGDFDALVDLLHPGIVLRIDAGARENAAASMLIQGADAVAKQSRAGLRTILNLPTVDVQPVLVNGSAGVVVLRNGQPISVMGFTISEGKITEIDSLADPARMEGVVRALKPGDIGKVRPR